VTAATVTLEHLERDLVVVGGGLAGCCAAIAAARHGVRVALLHNRPVLGGNASSEVGLLAAGADRDFRHARETGIMEEINLENRYRNHEVLWSNHNMDLVLWTLVREAGVDLFLNTNVDAVEMDGSRIRAVTGTQLGTEKRFRVAAPLFVDSSGDAAVAALAGADVRRGSEGRGEFGESRAPEEPSDLTQGSTLMFRTKNLGRPVPFVRPEWAYVFERPEDLPVKVGRTDGGFLWIEYGAKLDTIADNELIRDELWKILYGVWDHLKNHGDYGMENEVLAWVASWPGKRESRRVMGDYILSQNDLTEPSQYEDAVAVGGWPCDVHSPEGFWAKGRWLDYMHLPGPYPIPYRCYYSRNVENLFLAGRDISTTHVAHGSTRLQATCAVGGQAVGTAAAMCLQYGKNPREVGRDHIAELQQVLLKDDAWIPRAANTDPLDLARRASVSSPSEYRDEHGYLYSATSVISGVSRGSDRDENLWMSQPRHQDGPWELRFSWEAPVRIGCAQLTFDTMIREQRFFDKPYLGAIPTCVRRYRILLEAEGGEWVQVAEVTGNHLRHNIVEFAPRPTRAVRICIDETNGDPLARVYEARLYEARKPLVAVRPGPPDR
jgi:hypothetical protein